MLYWLSMGNTILNPKTIASAWTPQRKRRAEQDRNSCPALVVVVEQTPRGSDSRSETRVMGKEAFVIENNDGVCWQSLGDAAARVIAKVRQP
jgi:hypothetical protein